MTEYSIPNLRALNKVVSEMIQVKKESNIFFFYGNLGAGKTTTIQSFCRHLGYNEEVTSPTFSLANEYRMDNLVIFHLDLYRLQNEFEVIDMGIEDYLYDGDYCFVEWPQIIENIINEPYYKVLLEAMVDGTRKLTIDLIK